MAQEIRTRSRDDVRGTNEFRTEELIEGTIMRITGAGNYIVYPVTENDEVRVGNPVRIIVGEKIVSAVASLEAREDHISTPILSNWAIIVSGHQNIERCRVFYNNVQLSTIDHMGTLRSEMRLPRADSLWFRIPDTMEVNDAYLVEVRDGDRLLRSETFGSIRFIPAPPSRV